MRRTPFFGYLEGNCVEQGLTEVFHELSRLGYAQQASRGAPKKSHIGATNSVQLLLYSEVHRAFPQL
jgi:hypothetical protein